MSIRYFPFGAGRTLTERAAPDCHSALRERRVRKVRRQIESLAPQPGDMLLFYGPERPRSRLICWYTRSRFYHVGIYAGDGKVIEARLPRVVCRDLYHELDGYRFVVIRAPGGAGPRALAWAENRVGGPYDCVGVALLALGRLPLLRRLLPDAARPDSCFVCGSFVARAFAAAGAELFPGCSPDAVAPADFAALIRRYAGQVTMAAPEME